MANPADLIILDGLDILHPHNSTSHSKLTKRKFKKIASAQNMYESKERLQNSLMETTLSPLVFKLNNKIKEENSKSELQSHQPY